MKRYNHIMKHVFNSPLAILPEKMAEISSFLLSKAGVRAWADHEGDDRDQEIAYGVYDAKARPSSSVQGSVAVIPLFGVVAQRMDAMEEMSGGTSTERFSKQFKALLDDATVKAIVINIDSPGGSVYGTQELADLIYQGREKKHIVSIANSLAASAAYWIGSAADEFVVTPGGQVGSIGVITVHEDWSKAYEEAGVVPTIIQAGKYKSEGTWLKPLDEEAKDAIQKDIDAYYNQFVNAVARNRGVSAKDVRAGFGQGRCLMAADAKAEGMVDRIDTLDGVLARLGVTQSSSQGGARISHDHASRALAMETV